MELRDVIYGVDQSIARITLNRPEKLNAVSWDTWAELEATFAAADADDDVKVIVVTGAGRGFCAGTDLTFTPPEAGPVARPFSERKEKQRSRYLVTAQIYHTTKPTIAAVNGVAVGAGFSLALACDIRIASSDARFSAIFVKRALSADTGMSWFLPRLVGEERALELLYTGRMVSAEEALRIGLVSEVVPAEALGERVSQLAAAIANGPSLAIEIDKRLVRESSMRALDEHIELEAFLQGVTQRSEDAIEGRKSFAEKREPHFRGR